MSTLPTTTQTIIERLRSIEKNLIDPDFAVKLLEELPDAIIIVNDTGSIQLVNRQTEMLFGYHRTELFDQNVDILVPNGAKSKHENYRINYMDEPKVRPMGLRQSEVKGRRKDGREFDAEINLSPIITIGGVLVLASIRKKRVLSIVPEPTS